MIVKQKRQIHISDAEYLSNWIDPEKHYIVLSINGTIDGIKYRIMSKDNLTPSLYHASFFDTVSRNIDDGWIFRIYDDGDWELSPESFAQTGFWELFFDGDVGARKTFDRTAKALGVS